MGIRETFEGLFGFKFLRNEPEEQKVSFVAPATDGTIIETTVGGISGGHFGMAFDLEGSYKSENDLITRYRELAMYGEVDSAIQDIVNEAIAEGQQSEIVSLDLSQIEGLPEKVAEKIHAEFETVLEVFDFNQNASEMFRRWYVDGRIYFHLVIDNKDPKAGIAEARYIDSTKLKKLTEVIKENDYRTGTPILGKGEEYFLYSELGTGTGIKISADSVASSTSGMIDYSSGSILSFMHKAIRPANQLRMVEDAVIIYHMSRAPERRAFYIDVGNQPKHKADQYVRELMNQYRNKMVYDAKTGEVKDSKKFLSMMEDFWLPVREGEKGTKIETLAGGSQLAQQLENVEYFRKKLFSSLNIPVSRLDTANAFNTGRTTEITRDEVKFAKFIQSLRRRFGQVLMDALRVQLLLRGVMTVEDWDELHPKIQLVFSKDNHFAELKELSVLDSRLDILQKIDSYAGKFYSKQFIMSNVLGLTDEEITEMNSQMASETAGGEAAAAEGDGAPPPGAGMGGGDMGGMPDMGGMDMGAPEMGDEGSPVDTTPTGEEDTIGQMQPDEAPLTDEEPEEEPTPEFPQ